MLQHFLTFIKEHQLLASNETTLLAVSGGVDSVVMTALFDEAQLPFAIAHCNFGLRTAATVDETFVRHLAQRYQVDFYTQSFDVTAYARQKNISIQMAARALRYAWFHALLQEHGLTKLATAHHASDSSETMLLNLIKGTGIAGLHGILPKKGKLIRPFLFADKAMVLQYAKEKKIAWREDASNQHDYYQRNFLRNQVMPLLKTINPNFDTTLQSTMERISQAESLCQAQVETIKKRNFYFKDAAYWLAIQNIRQKPWAPMVTFEIVKPFGFTFAQIKALWQAANQSGKMIVSKKYTLTTDRQHWLITPRMLPTDLPLSVTATTTSLKMACQTLHFAIVPKNKYTLSPTSTIAALDYALLTFPLTLRKWRSGDFFYPLGMPHKKKISDFLIDLKVPRPIKEQVYVMTSAGKIAAVIGYRIDHRFKITDATQQVYEIK